MAVVASAPGKVLITGGYLILDRPNAGIVLSTNARFYAIVRPIYEEIKPESWAWAWTDVRLTSPQLSREAFYKLSLTNATLQCTSSRDSVNPFVEQAVQYSVAAAMALLNDTDKKSSLRNTLLLGIDITVLGCNDFYSFRNMIEARGLPLTFNSLERLPPFSSITLNSSDSTATFSEETCKPEVAKTGLGSSAAMTTSVVAAFLQYLKVINLQSPSRTTMNGMSLSDLELVHIIAQCAHCIAQGKVGSGFDVSSAVYGSQRYVRFSPSVLSPAQILAPQYRRDAVIDVMKEKWDNERVPFSLPPLMELLLGEPGTGGSSTPSMVGAIKRWQEVDPEKSLLVWKHLAEANTIVENKLKALSKVAEEDRHVYENALVRCSKLHHSQWMERTTNEREKTVIDLLQGVRDAFSRIRSCMKQMGDAAGVPIEPESQTQLLNATMNIEGTLIAGVPGAGGFDAVFAITIGNSRQRVAQLWTSLRVLPLLITEDPRGVSLENGDPRFPNLFTEFSSIQIK